MDRDTKIISQSINFKLAYTLAGASFAIFLILISNDSLEKYVRNQYTKPMEIIGIKSFMLALTMATTSFSTLFFFKSKYFFLRYHFFEKYLNDIIQKTKFIFFVFLLSFIITICVDMRPILRFALITKKDLNSIVLSEKKPDNSKQTVEYPASPSDKSDSSGSKYDKNGRSDKDNSGSYTTPAAGDNLRVFNDINPINSADSSTINNNNEVIKELWVMVMKLNSAGEFEESNKIANVNYRSLDEAESARGNKLEVATLLSVSCSSGVKPGPSCSTVVIPANKLTVMETIQIGSNIWQRVQ